MRVNLGHVDFGQDKSHEKVHQVIKSPDRIDIGKDALIDAVLDDPLGDYIDRFKFCINPLGTEPAYLSRVLQEHARVEEISGEVKNVLMNEGGNFGFGIWFLINCFRKGMDEIPQAERAIDDILEEPILAAVIMIDCWWADTGDIANISNRDIGESTL